MSDIKLFRLVGGNAKQIEGAAAALEKPLQTLIEANLDPLFGIRFLATEQRTGKAYAGRIDTLGIDENNCPVIIEYKRSLGENVINQGLFYLNWLLDHQADFKFLVLDRYGSKAANDIDWSAPRLLCIAADFTKYDVHAVQQINRNIDLIRYRRFGPDLLLFELVNSVAADPIPTGEEAGAKPSPSGKTATTGDKPVSEWLADMPAALGPVFDGLDRYILSLGDDVQRKDLKLYVAFKRLRNFATVTFQKKILRLYLHLDPDEVKLEEGFARDVRTIGHWGTGNTEIILGSLADLEKAKPYIDQAYAGGTDAG
jgi:predicted transport protein